MSDFTAPAATNLQVATVDAHFSSDGHATKKRKLNEANTSKVTASNETHNKFINAPTDLLQRITNSNAVESTFSQLLQAVVQETRVYLRPTENDPLMWISLSDADETGEREFKVHQLSTSDIERLNRLEKKTKLEEYVLDYKLVNTILYMPSTKSLDRLLSEESPQSIGWNDEKNMNLAWQILQIAYALENEYEQYNWNVLKKIYIDKEVLKIGIVGIVPANGGMKSSLAGVLSTMKRVLAITDDTKMVQEQAEVFLKMETTGRDGSVVKLAEYVLNHHKILTFFTHIADHIEINLNLHAQLESGLKIATGIQKINWLVKGSVCEVFCKETGIDKQKYDTTKLVSLIMFMRDYQRQWRQENMNKIEQFFTRIKNPTKDPTPTHFYRTLRDSKDGNTSYQWLFCVTYSVTKKFFKSSQEIGSLFK